LKVFIIIPDNSKRFLKRYTGTARRAPTAERFHKTMTSSLFFMSRAFPYTIKYFFFLLLVASLICTDNLAAVNKQDYKTKRAAVARLQAFRARQSSGNNFAFYLSNNGFLAINPTSSFAPGGFWPSGSTNNYVYQSGLNVLGIVDADGDGVFGDTVETSAVYDAEWREGYAAGSKDDPDARLFFSTADEDLSDWPDEFRTIDADPDSPTFGLQVPRIIGDQDVVTVFTDVDGPIFTSAGVHRLGLEVSARVVLISTGVERDIMYLNWSLENASYYVSPAEVAQTPYDIRGVLVDIKTDFDIGVATDDASAIMPTRQLALAYDSDFSEKAFGRQPGIMGSTILYSPVEDDGLDNPTVLEPEGNGLVDETFGEIMDAGLTHPLTGKPFDFPEEVRGLKAERFYLYTMYTYGDQRPDPFSDAEAYRILSAAPGAGLLPAFDPYAGFLEATIIEDLRQNIVTGSFDLEADSRPVQVWAAFYFSPAANDPAVNGIKADLSQLNPEGEFSRVLSLAEAARRTYDADFLRPKPPPAPEFRLVPGDRQVTITWDDFPVKNTYDDYVESFQASQLVLRDSIPDGFPRITGYRADDFEGFRVYRSLTGERKNAVLIAQFDLDNGIVDYDVTRTVSTGGFTGTGLYNLKLGNDSGISFSFVDRGQDLGGLVNGVPVFYTVTSYDYNPFNNQGESLESNIGFKRQDALGRFVQQVSPRAMSSSYRPGGYESGLAGGDGGELGASGRRTVSDTLGSSADTMTVDPLDPQNRSVLRHNLVVDFLEAPRPQTGALVAGKVEIIYGQVLPDSGVFVIDSLEAVSPATRKYNMYYHYHDSHGRVVAGKSLEKTFPPNFAEKVATFRFDGRDDTLGATYSGWVEIRRGGREDAKVAPLRINGVTGTLLSPGVAYPHPDYRFITLPAVIGFPGEPFVVHQPMNIEQLNSEDFLRESSRTTSNMAAFAPADIEITWESETSVKVRDITHNVDIRFSEFTDDGWGFLPLDKISHEEMIWQSLHVHPKYKRRYRLSPEAVYYSHPEKPDSVSMGLYVRGIELFVTAVRSRPKAGDVWHLRSDFNSSATDQTSPVPGQRVVFRFRRATDRPEDEDLNRIRVVPNPYFVSSALDPGPGNKAVQFVGLPRECTIRVYTVSGILVNVLEHGPGVAESSYSAYDSGGGQRLFNLRNRFGLEMAGGTYFFHVESRTTGKEFIGKFSIIN